MSHQTLSHRVKQKIVFDHMHQGNPTNADRYKRYQAMEAAEEKGKEMRSKRLGPMLREKAQVRLKEEREKINNLNIDHDRTKKDSLYNQSASKVKSTIKKNAKNEVKKSSTSKVSTRSHSGWMHDPEANKKRTKELTKKRIAHLPIPKDIKEDMKKM
jgi:hypothetical protein